MPSTVNNLKIFLVEVNASCYDNDVNYVVLAESEEQAEQLVNTYFAFHLTALKGSKLNITELPNRLGIIYEFDPHAGDEEID